MHLIFLKFFIYFERKRERVGRGTEREEDRESEAGSEPTAVNLMWGSNSQTVKIVTWAKVESLTDWATQAPLYLIFFLKEEGTGPTLGKVWACSRAPTLRRVEELERDSGEGNW